MNRSRLLAWFTWLTVPCMILALWVLGRTAIRADLERQRAIQDSQREERVSLALWRLDAFLAPIIAREAARPYAYYRGPAGMVGTEPPSADYVAFRFHWPREVGGNDSEASPRPDPRFAKLRERSSWESLRERLPSTEIPRDISQLATNQGDPRGSGASFENSLYVGNQIDPAKPKSGNPVDDDLNQRNRGYQSQTAQQIRQQREAPQDPSSQRQIAPPEVVATEGLCLPLWLDDALLLARRTEFGDELAIQGCQLRWQLLRNDLLHEIEDLFPDADLLPIRDGSLPSHRTLAGIPVRLDVAGNAAAEIGRAHV